MQKPCFCSTGIPGQDNEVILLTATFKILNQETAHGFIATLYSRIIQPCLFQPLLTDLRTQSTPKTIQIARRILLGMSKPLFDTLFFHLPGNQLLP